MCYIRTKKNDVHRTRLTVCGDRLQYRGNSASPAASLIDTKMIINSVLLDARKSEHFLTVGLKDEFLQSDLPEPEYMKIHGRYFFQDIGEKYNIDQLIAEDGYVLYFKTKKGCYGLKQAAKLARDKLIKHLAQYGYSPHPFAPKYRNTRHTQ